MHKILFLLYSISSFTYAQVVNSPSSGKVEFRVQYSFGSNSNMWEQTFNTPSDDEADFKSSLDDIARTTFNSSQRKNAISSLCQGHSETDKMKMARYLGDQFVDGYDQNKTRNASTNQVWNAYKERLDGNTVKSGTSPEHMLAIGEFLGACGIPKNRISIEQFQTAKGAHQIVTVLGDDGKIHSLNYSELYTANYNPFFNSGIETSYQTIGIKHTRFDVETKRVIDTRMTELGHILMAVTGGKVDDPDYIPELLQIEANYKVLSGGAYMATTQRGELIRGVKIAYDKRPFKWLHIKAGLTYAHSELNSLSIAKYSGFSANQAQVGQHNIFMQFRGTIDIPDLQLLKKGNHRLFIKSNVDISLALALMWTKSDAINNGNSNFNSDQFNVTTLDSYLVYRNPKMEAKLGGGVETSISLNKYSTQRANGMFPFPFIRGNFIKAEFTLKGSKLDIKAGGKVYFFSYGLDQRYYLAFLEKKRFMLLNVGVYNHTDRAGKNYPFATAGIKKEFKVNKAGTIGVGVEGMSSISKDPNYQIMFNLSYTPDFRDRKKPKPASSRDTWRLRREKDAKKDGN